jgi:hypothetical protein
MLQEAQQGDTNRDSVFDEPGSNPGSQRYGLLNTGNLLVLLPRRLWRRQIENGTAHPKEVLGQVFVHQLEMSAQP